MACPFVALESDRDRRSEEPDHRHRCYAEPDPAPRALAHQREYCLAAAFTTCPIFQDWAIRAAATPVPLRPGRMPDTEREEEPAWAAPPWFDQEAEPGADAQPSADEGASPAAAGLTSAATAPAEVDGFVPPPERPSADVERMPSSEAREEPIREEAVREEAVREEAVRAEAVRAEAVPEAAPLPAFLSGRADQLKAERAREAALPHETLRREDVVPVWGRDPSYARAGSRLGLDAGDLISKITTVLAVAVILSLAVVAIVLAPSLLGFGGGAGPTAPGGGIASPTAGAPTVSPTPAPTPAPTPRTYTIQAGDTLFSIAVRHGLTLEQLLLANPEITNPDLVQIGQVLIIPDDDFGLFTPSPSP